MSSKKPLLVILSPPGEPSVVFPMTEGSHFVSDLPAQEAFSSPKRNEDNAVLRELFGAGASSHRIERCGALF